MTRIVGMAALLALVACARSDRDPEEDLAQGEAALVAFERCAELEDYIENTAIRQMYESLHTHRMVNYAREDANAGAAPDAAADKGPDPTTPRPTPRWRVWTRRTSSRPTGTGCSTSRGAA